MAVTLYFCDACSDKRVKDVKDDLETLFQKKQVDLFSCGICCCEIIPVRKEHVAENLNHQEGIQSKPDLVGEGTGGTPKEVSKLIEDSRQNHKEEEKKELERNLDPLGNPDDESDPNCFKEMKRTEGKPKTTKTEENTNHKMDVTIEKGKTRKDSRQNHEEENEEMERDFNPSCTSDDESDASSTDSDEMKGKERKSKPTKKEEKTTTVVKCKTREDSRQNGKEETEEMERGSDPSCTSDDESDASSNYSDEIKSIERNSKSSKKKEKTSCITDVTTSVTRKKRNILEMTDLNPKFIKDAILEGSLTFKKYACKFCKKEFKLNATMVKMFCLHLCEHMKQAQVPKPYRCPVCETCFMGFAFLKKHTRDHTNPTCYRCPHPDCDRKFKHKKSVNSHEELVHKGLVDTKLCKTKSYVCEICSATLEHASSLKKHMFQHKEFKPFKCDDCDRCFITKANLNRHRERHNESKKTMCEICGKTFVLLNDLKTHSITHTDERLYQCEYCPYRAKRLRTLRAHIRNIHTEADPNKFKCNYCGLIFLSATACTKHQKKHQVGMDLSEHLLKPYQCSDCGYRARKPSHIRIHRRSHTGEKPFKCIYCVRAFTQNGQCKRHMKICKKR